MTCVYVWVFQFEMRCIRTYEHDMNMELEYDMNTEVRQYAYFVSATGIIAGYDTRDLTLVVARILVRLVHTCGSWS